MRRLFNPGSANLLWFVEHLADLEKTASLWYGPDHARSKLTLPNVPHRAGSRAAR
jgi:hypothetical protein